MSRSLYFFASRVFMAISTRRTCLWQPWLVGFESCRSYSKFRGLRFFFLQLMLSGFVVVARDVDFSAPFIPPASLSSNKPVCDLDHPLSRSIISYFLSLPENRSIGVLTPLRTALARISFLFFLVFSAHEVEWGIWFWKLGLCIFF